MSDEISYFGGDLDRVVGLVFQLASEVHVATQRSRALEAVLVRSGVLSPGEVDAFVPDDGQAEELAAVRDAAVHRLLRILTEDGPAEHPLRAEAVRRAEG